MRYYLTRDNEKARELSVNNLYKVQEEIMVRPERPGRYTFVGRNPCSTRHTTR